MKLNYNNELYHNDEFLQWWIFIKIMNIYHKYKFSSIDDNDQFHHQDEFSSQRLILIKLMNFHHNDEFCYTNEFVSRWWIFIIIMNFHHTDEFSSKYDMSSNLHECKYNKFKFNWTELGQAQPQLILYIIWQF